MAKIEFTTEELQGYFFGKVKHDAYTETVELAEQMRIHSDGVYPKKLIEERRPSESDAVHDYRQSIWKPITKSEFGKILTCLNKIRRSAEWSIKFNANAGAIKRIPEGETLADYFETKFPYFNNFTSWIFEVLLRAYCIDSNALVITMPIEEDVPVNGYVRPYPFIFYSDQVIDFQENDYAVVKSTEKATFTDNGIDKEGNIFYVVTTENIEKYVQTSSTGDYILEREVIHNIGILPAVKTKGILKEIKGKSFLYESRLAGIIPRFDEAIREYSDLQAEVVQNIFSEKWEYVSDDCPRCKGSGEITPYPGGACEPCQVCKGTGNRTRGPYSSLQLKPPMAGEATLPTPPVGYVQKQIDIAKLQDDRVDKHIYKGFSSINMEFLAETPLAQSGIAKDVDRDELNTFFNGVAEGLVAVADSVVYFTNEYRYAFQIPDLGQRIDMLPIISVPEKFDVLTVNYLELELQNAKNNKMNPIIVTALEIDYANKKFSADPSVRDKVSLTLALDPLAGISEEDKMIRLSNGGITKANYIISCNIQYFIERAIDENGDAFFNLSMKDKKLIMQEYATEQINLNSASQEILGEVE